MKKPNKVYCLFEQSGTFKNEFIKMGIPAEDYDIQNIFGQTDHIIDLFREIEEAYIGRASIFDGMTKDDLIMAFFPCTYFCGGSQLSQTYKSSTYINLSIRETTDKIIQREENRTRFLVLLTKLFYIIKERKLRMIFENPRTNNYLLLPGCFVEKPTLFDYDRTKRGDILKKPTAYWFVGCSPTFGQTIQQTKHMYIKKTNHQKKSNTPGICNIYKSMISPDYARNFICDFILGIEQKFSQTQINFDIA